MPPPCTAVMPPWCASSPRRPVIGLKSPPGCSVEAIVRWSLPWPSMMLTISIVESVAVGREDVRDRVDADRAVADAARVLAGLAERAGAAAEAGEVEAGAHVQAGQRGRGEVAGQVLACCRRRRRSACRSAATRAAAAATRNGGRLSSPGSRTAPCSERSAEVVPPSTASGPRMPPSRCGCLPNVVRFWRPGARMKNGSATSGTVICWYQLPHVAPGRSAAGCARSGAVNVATAAHCVDVSSAVRAVGAGEAARMVGDQRARRSGRRRCR